MAALRRLVQRNNANVASLPAPIGGWNARDSLANMAPTDAVTLDYEGGTPNTPPGCRGRLRAF